jgi:hypothetical protein
MLTEIFDDFWDSCDRGSRGRLGGVGLSLGDCGLGGDGFGV